MIRQMVPDDIPDCLSVRTSTIENVVTREELKKWGISKQSLTSALSKNTRGWVFEASDQIVGFSMVDLRIGELLVLAVLPEYENKGIGSTLLLQAQNYLFSLGHQFLQLKTEPNKDYRAYGFYQYFGWEPTGVLIDGDEIFKISTVS